MWLFHKAEEQSTKTKSQLAAEKQVLITLISSVIGKNLHSNGVVMGALIHQKSLWIFKNIDIKSQSVLLAFIQYLLVYAFSLEGCLFVLKYGKIVVPWAVRFQSAHGTVKS